MTGSVHLPITTTDYDSVEQFLDAVEELSYVRLIKVEDQGLVGPARRGSATVMQPMVRVVATAFDHKNDKVLRWERTRDVGGGVVTTPVGNGSLAADPTGRQTRDEIISLAELRSLTTSRGEWTPGGIARTLAGLSSR